MKRGIDVSVHQGDINWAKVKADGIDFAMIKATQGRSVTGTYRDFTDSRFVQNIIGVNRWGIRCGVYHYLTAQTVAEALHEAEYFLSVIDPYKSIISLYAAVDVEEDMYLPRDKQLLTQIVYTFCSRVQAAGYDPIIYTNPNYLTYRLGDVSKYPLWLALWRNKNKVPTTAQYPALRIWQWGSEAVDGIGGKTDANFMIAEKPMAVEPEVPKSEATQKTEHVADVGKMVDAETPSMWAAGAFAWAKDVEILLGDGDGKYRPHDPLTREEACLVTERVYRLLLNDAPEAVARVLYAALGGK